MAQSYGALLSGAAKGAEMAHLKEKFSKDETIYSLATQFRNDEISFIGEEKFSSQFYKIKEIFECFDKEIRIPLALGILGRKGFNGTTDYLVVWLESVGFGGLLLKDIKELGRQ